MGGGGGGEERERRRYSEYLAFYTVAYFVWRISKLVTFTDYMRTFLFSFINNIYDYIISS